MEVLLPTGCLRPKAGGERAQQRDELSRRLFMGSLKAAVLGIVPLQQLEEHGARAALVTAHMGSEPHAWSAALQFTQWVVFCLVWRRADSRMCRAHQHADIGATGS